LPEIGVIQKPGLFEDILRRLGVNRPTRPFTLDGNILPVILVDSGVSFVAAPTPAYGVVDIFSAGVITNPAAGAVMADTGPLPVGSYTVQVLFSIGEAAIEDFEWRDAANAATLVSHSFRNGTALGTLEFSTRLEVANANERFRVINPNLGAANYQVTILAKL